MATTPRGIPRTVNGTARPAPGSPDATRHSSPVTDVMPSIAWRRAVTVPTPRKALCGHDGRSRRWRVTSGYADRYDGPTVAHLVLRRTVADAVRGHSGSQPLPRRRCGVDRLRCRRGSWCSGDGGCRESLAQSREARSRRSSSGSIGPSGPATLAGHRDEERR
jgi:hypothetical protein